MGEGEGGANRERLGLTHIHSAKQIANGKLLLQPQELARVVCDDPEGVDEVKRGQMYAYD